MSLPGKNIEFKAVYENHDLLREKAQKAGAQKTAIMRQKDTYFRVSGQRLKIREIEGVGAEIINYRRSDVADLKESNYSVKHLRFPQFWRWYYSFRHGLLVHVVKQRELWMWQDVRIHIDAVEGLGNFMELEAVVNKIGDEEIARDRCRLLMELLSVDKESLVERSYSDLLLAKLSFEH